MAKFGLQYGDQDEGQISFKQVDGHRVEAYWHPSRSRLEAARRTNEATPDEGLMAIFDTRRRMTKIFPLNTLPGSDNFLGPKHDPIECIEIEDPEDPFDSDYSFTTPEAVRRYLEEDLPNGFVRDPNYGLGFDRTLKFIVDALSRIEGVKTVRLTRSRDLDVAVVDGGATYEMGFALFDALRRGANRFDNASRRLSRRKKVQLAYSNLLTRFDNDRFPAKVFDRKPGDISEMMGTTFVDARLSDTDRSSIVGMAAKIVRSSLPSQRSGLMKLREEIELASLDELICAIEGDLHKAKSEAYWQKQFTLNPFILDMAFGASMVLIQDQAHVGGKLLDGSGEKITDYLLKNERTDSVAIVEIKRPSAELVGKREYRGGVYRPSPELVGSVVQLLDQMDRFHSNLHQIRSVNRRFDLEGHGIKGVLVVGLTPEREMMRSFELYRSSLHGLTIITFDELLGKLKSLREFLSGA